MIRERPNGTFEVRVSKKGLLPKPLYFTFTDRAEAEDYEKRLIAQLNAGIIPAGLVHRVENSGLSPEVIGMMREYREAVYIKETEHAVLMRLAQRLPKHMRLTELTFTWANAWIASMKRERNLGPATVRHYVGALARCLDWAAASGRIAVNPLRLLPIGYSTYSPEDVRQAVSKGGKKKVNVSRDRRIEEGEEARIRAVLAGVTPEGHERGITDESREDMTLMFEFAVESAMRMREIFTLSWGQIDLEKRTIFLDKTKNGDKRQVPITSVLLAILTPRKGKKDEFVIGLFDGNFEYEKLAASTARFSQRWARIAALAGCDDLRFHDLRHEATSRIYERTQLTDLQISKITGHKNLQMLRRYANLRASDLATAMW